MWIINVEMQFNLKLNIAHKIIGVVDEQTSHAIERYKY